MRLFTIVFSFASLATASLEILSSHSRPTCVVKPLGKQQSDVPNILQAFHKCGHSGTIVFPENETYWIAEHLNPHVKDITIDWRGTWLFSDNLTYWRDNAYPITFQNHAAGFVLSGSNIRINGHGTGSINGNGDAWYTAEAGKTQRGRPMPFVLWNITNVQVSNFAINQPQLWSINIMNGTNMKFANITVSANASAAPEGENWTQNTDGFDTMDAANITLQNFTFTGGDDCVAIKPRSSNIRMSNITCNGGNGIAIGSLGQYLEDSSVENVIIDHAKVAGSRFGTYIKTWVGELVPTDDYESGYVPRGGGWGVVRDVTFSNIDVGDAQRAVVVTQDNGDDGTSNGTSKMEISGIRFQNYTGVLGSSNGVTVSCSEVHPCFDIEFDGFDVVGEDGEEVSGSCEWTAEGGVTGLDGC